MACVKLGSKSDAFQRQGQAWFCTTGLPSDVVVEVGEMSFHLHKFPLLSRSGVMEKLIAETPTVERGCVVSLPDVPGGPKTFELIARFCYGIKLELTVSNAAHLRCAAEYLEMTEDYGEGNLISQTESFINQVILRGWKDSLRTLQMCEDILPHSERLQIPRRCIESLATRACSCTDPNLFSGPITEHGGPMQSPGGSVLWNGISTGAWVKNPATDWWYEDASTLSLPLYKRLLAAMEAMGMRQEIIAGSLDSYAKKHLPVLSRRHTDPGSKISTLSEEDQRALLEEIDRLLPMQKGLVPTKSLFGLLRTAKILKVDPDCVSSLEKRIGLQLDEARLEDLLMTNLSYSVETLYDVDFVQRVLEHFLRMDRATGDESPGSVDDGRLMGSPSLTPITMVAKLIDGYLAEVATDVNLKLPKFRSLAAAVPEYARPLDDGLYHAIDLYLKSHPWLAETEREDLCRLIDCQKLSLEACTHATQNERLPLRIIIQVLFFEQLQLRTSIAGCYLISGNLDGSRGLNEGGGRWATAEALRAGMDNMRVRVGELERECWSMRREIERMGRSVRWSSAWERVSTKLGFGLKTQICSAEEGSVRRGDVKGDGKNKKKTKKKVVLGE